MSKHTPGPWVATGYKQTIVNDSLGNTIAMYPTGDRTTETARANARLIAAAPELLEALEALSVTTGEAAALTSAGLVVPVKVWQSVVDSLNQSSAAIAKAKGVPS